jgi:hypothetical protein
VAALYLRGSQPRCIALFGRTNSKQRLVILAIVTRHKGKHAGLLDHPSTSQGLCRISVRKSLPKLFRNDAFSIYTPSYSILSHVTRTHQHCYCDSIKMAIITPARKDASNLSSMLQAVHLTHLERETLVFATPTPSLQTL